MLGRVSEPASGLGFGVRRGSSTDFDAVSALYSAVAAEGLWIGAEAPVEWTSQRREAWCRTADEEERGAWFLAEDDAAQLVGYLAVTRSGAEHADFGMAVAAAQRGHGVGGALLDAAVAWCRDAALSKINCQVWPHNGAADDPEHVVGDLDDVHRRALLHSPSWSPGSEACRAAAWPGRR